MSCISPMSLHFSTKMISLMNRDLHIQGLQFSNNKRVIAIAEIGCMILYMVAFPIFLPFTMLEIYNLDSTKVTCMSALDIPLAVILYFPVVAFKTVQLALAALIHPAIAFKS